MDNRPPPRPSPAGLRQRWPLRRLWAVALVTFRQGMRMRLWILVPLAIVVLVLADLSSPRFDPVFEAVPAAMSTSLLVMTVLAVVVGIFMATYSIPAEVESKVAYTVVTKPVSRSEIVVGKTLGMSLLVLAMLVPVGLGAYIYITIRSGGVQTLAAERLAEARPRAIHPADLNAMEEVARQGPLMTFRYQEADAGPEPAVHFAPDAAPTPGLRWIVGESGMRMAWDLTPTPLAEWAAAGPCVLHFSLEARRPPGAPEDPVRVLVGLSNPRGKHRAEPAGDDRQGPVHEVAVAVPASGDLEVPVVAPDVSPAKGVLNLPAPGELVLDVLVEKAGHVVGAKAGALRLVGPAGQQATAARGPDISASQPLGRAMLVGRPQLPRQMAVFRFDNIPAHVLGQGDTAVELGFSLDAWGPATEQPAAEATFIKPDTGEQRTLRFTPESHRSTLVYVDRAFWHGGPLEVRVECLTADDYLYLVPRSVQLRLVGGPFALHLAKAAFHVWLFGTVLAAAAVVFSVRFTWFVSILGTLAFVLLSVLRDFALHQTPIGYPALLLTKWGLPLTRWSGWPSLAQHLALPIPDLRAMLPGEAVNGGEVIPWTQLGASFGWAMFGVAVLLVIAALLFRNREVAA